jgi:hypothetical protein
MKMNKKRDLNLCSKSLFSKLGAGNDAIALAELREA